MMQKYNIDNILQTVLKDSVKKVDMSNNSFDLIKQRIHKPNRNVVDILKQKTTDYSVAMRFNTRKSVASLLCSFFLIVCLSIALIPPARAIAMDSFKTLYMPFRNANGQYESKLTDNVRQIKLPRSITTQSDKDLTKAVGYTVKFPIDFNDKYSLSGKWLITGLEGTSAKFVAGLYTPKEIPNRAKLLLYIVKSKSQDFVHVKELWKKGDNNKELTIKNVKVHYFETAVPKGDAVIENLGNTSLDEPTEFLTSHSLSWEQNGIGYCITDSGNDIPIEDMTKIVEEINSNK